MKVECLYDLFLQEDLEYIASLPYIPWNCFENKTVLVTGATGLIGSQLVMALICRNRKFGGNIKVRALVRSPEKAQKIFAGIMDAPNFSLVVGDVNNALTIKEPVDFIVHGASVTSSKDFVSKPVETIVTAIDGTRNILEFACKQKLQGMVYLSSLEIYGVPAENLLWLTEQDSGHIDCMQVRSSYSEGKRMVECLCSSYASEYGVPVKVARLSQTFGTGVAYSDNRVFAQFARSAIEGSDIVLKTKGETFRNYCYTADAVSALLVILAKGGVGEAYNVANKGTGISIADMAQFVCEKFSDGKSNVVFDLVEDAAKLGYNPVVKINLDPSKLESLGWAANFDLLQMFERTIKSMKIKKA